MAQGQGSSQAPPGTPDREATQELTRFSPAAMAVAAGSPLQEVEQGVTPDVRDTPPPPEQSPYQDGGADGPKIGPAFQKLEQKIADINRRLQQFEDAHGVLAEAGSTAIRVAEDRLNTRLLDLTEDAHTELDTARGEMRATVEQLRVAMSDVRNELLSRASRAELDGVSKSLGTLGKTVAAFVADLAGLRTANDGHKRAFGVVSGYLENWKGVIAGFKERVGAVERLNGAMRDAIEGADHRSQETGDRVNAFATTLQTIARDIEALKGTGEGLTSALREIHEAAAQAQVATDARNTEMAERFGAIEGRLESLGRIVSTCASQDEVRRVNESVAAVRANVETFDARLKQLGADNARHAEMLEGLSGKMGGVESLVSGFEHQATALVETDAALRRRMNEIGEEADGLRGDYDALHLSVDELATFRATFGAQATRLSSDLEGMRGQLGDLIGSVRSTQGTADAHEGRVGRLEERLAILDEFRGLLERVEALRTKIVELNKWRRAFAGEAEAYARRLGLSPPPWVAAEKKRPD